MSIEIHRVAIGACGWKHSAWLNEFYSEDLPNDWQLGFYSNEFSVVYVPAADWLEHLDLDDWVDDVTESFRFILEVPSQLLSDETAFTAALNKVKSLKTACLGFVFQLEQAISHDVVLFQSRYDAARTIAPVCVDKQGIVIPKELEHALLKNNISEVWNGIGEENSSLARGSLAITRVSSEGLDMRRLRTVIETCLSVSNEDCVSVLILDGEPPSLEMLRNADILLNLL